MKNLTSVLLLFGFLLVNCAANAQAYFQQEVNYQINVRLNDVKHELSATESLVYTNNSPNQLDFLWFHLWPNGYRDDKTAFAKQAIENGGLDFYRSKAADRGFIDSLDFKVDGLPVKWNLDPNNPDICKLILNQPLAPGAKITITTPFHVKLPTTFSRAGHDGQAYQVSQWYPKPAVYDRFGWHPIPYLDQGEFFSEYGSFDVSITLPKNYLVGATGVLKTESEIEFLNQKVKETEAITKYDKKDGSFPVSDTQFKTIRYQESNIHDFAWFADKRYHVLKGELELPKSKRKVTTWAFFTNECADTWQHATDYVGDAVSHYSAWYGEYPYQNCTAVRGALKAGGAMEYPTVTVIGAASNKTQLELFIMHEVGHNWFYGILGFNEREYPFMDEGINSFSERRYMLDKYPSLDANDAMGGGFIGSLVGLKSMPYSDFYYTTYLLQARLGEDQPMNINAGAYTDRNVGAIVYMKTATEFNYLQKYLGDELFNKAMQRFYEDWKYKHPYPIDLQKCFEEVTGKDLSWFFKDIIGTTKKIDYQIQSADSKSFRLKNMGGIMSPVSVSGIDADGKIQFTNWYEGFAGTKDFTYKSKPIVQLRIDAQKDIPELNRSNNTIRLHGLFKRIEPIEIRALQIVEHPDRTQLGILPAVGWNESNKAMLGAIFYNTGFPSRLEYQLMPLYGFGNKSLAGGGHLGWKFYPESDLIRVWHFSLSGEQYAFADQQNDNFRKLKAEVEIGFRPSDERNNKQSKLKFSMIYATDILDITHTLQLREIYPETSITMGYKKYFNLEYSHQDRNVLSPFTFSAKVEGNSDYAKASMTFDGRLRYAKSNKCFYYRIFSGSMLYRAENLNSVYLFKVASESGVDDYQYGNTYTNRFFQDKLSNSGRVSQQVSVSDGGLVDGFNIYAKQLIALNVATDLPIPSTILYGSFAVFNSDYYAHNNDFEFGLKYSFGPLGSIFFPIYRKERDYGNLGDNNYWHRIRFQINFNKLNLFGYKNNI